MSNAARILFLPGRRIDAGEGKPQTPAGWPVYRINLIKYPFLLFGAAKSSSSLMHNRMSPRRKTKRRLFKADLVYKQATPLGFVGPLPNLFGASNPIGIGQEFPRS